MATTVTIEESIEPTEVRGMGRYAGTRQSTFVAKGVSCSTMDGRNFTFLWTGTKNGRNVQGWFFSRDEKLNEVRRDLGSRTRQAFLVGSRGI
jgi:hypothetical protein